MNLTEDNRGGRQRNDAIDALRAVLIFSVIIYHYFVFWAPPFSTTDFYDYKNTFPEWLAIGKYGVHAFFLISGYVIALTLGRSKNASDFLYRRCSRLLPALVVCCSITFLIALALQTDIAHVTVWNWVLSMTLHPDKFGGEFIDGSYWSLGVEIRFYLWVALFFGLLGKRYWIGICILGCLAITQDIFSLHFTNYYLIGSYISFFLVGMSFRCFEVGDRIPAIISLGIGVTLYAMRMTTFSVLNQHVIAVNCYIVGCALLLLIMTNTRVFDRIALGPLPYLGRVSYCLYLLHQTIGVTIIARLNDLFLLPNLAVAAIAGAFTLSLAMLVYHFIEVPAQRAMRNWQMAKDPITAKP